MSLFGSTLLITGKESLLAERAAAERRDAALREQPGADVNRITGAELAEAMLSEVVGGSLFSSRIVAIIDDVGACPAEMVDQLVAIAVDPGPDLCLILIHGGGVKGKALLDRLRKAKVETVTVEAPKPRDLARFVTAEAKAHRRRMSDEAADALVAAVGSDLRTIVAAVAQLAQDVEGEVLDVTVIRRYFAGRAEVSSFSVADAVLARNASLALERLRWALGTGVAPVLVTAALANNFRAMGKYLDASGSRISDGDLARQLGVPFFKVRDLRTQARHWDQRGVADAIVWISEADAGVKGASTDPHFALEALVLRLLAARPRR